ncbi:MAG: GNAT family N-acetyltransferase [Proteobacteria bacterium]|nr:GNAT family N-acetyltransferase [Pseudomonadota bacterium]
MRPIQAADLEAIHRLVVEVSWPHRLADCRMLVDLGGGFVAVDPLGQIIGMAMWWRFGEAGGTVGMVLVSPAYQGGGIGRRLMMALLEDAGQTALMLNATAAGLALYDRLGFRRAGQVRQHQGRVTSIPAASAAHIRRVGIADHEALVALDAAAFGMPRAGLIMRLLAIGKAWVVESEAGLTGFAIRREFGRGEMIGPVIAAAENDAIALIAAAVDGTGPGLLRIDIPAGGVAIAGWLTQAGLAPVGTVTTMIRGAWPESARMPYRFALALQAVG